MQEYRTRLIANVVTGKLNIQEATAKLPDEVEEWDAPLYGRLDSIEGLENFALDAELEEVEA